MTKFYVILLLAFVTITKAFAQTPIPISAVRSQPNGTTVTVAGIVMNGGEIGPIRYIDDGTAGIGLYFAPAQVTQAAQLQRGDSVVATGIIAPFNNLMELTPVDTFTVVSRRNRIHPPIEFTAATWANAYAEDYEGRLVRLNRIPNIRTSAGAAVSTFGGNTNYRLNNNTTLIARVVNSSTGDTGIVSKPAPTDTFDVVGVMSQFSSVSPTSGYQLLPRLFADFISGPAPNIITAITQLNVTQTSLTISYTTDNPGNSVVEYGLTPAFGNLITDPTNTLVHTLSLTNLLPGRIYYVKASSSNGSGTSIANVTTFVTESQSSGRMKTYFTRSIRAQEALPGNLATHVPASMDDTLIAYINRAQESLDIAIYNWNNSGLSDITVAVNNAFARGVKVRVISDGDAANLGVNGLNPAIRRLASPQGAAPGGGFYSIMHNKFVIIDAESTNPNNPWLWTGSTNWTSGMINTDYNNSIAIQDQSLARVFKLEFEEMWGSDSLRPGVIFNGTTGTARFGASKTDNTPDIVKVGGKIVNTYFSPTDAVQSKIVETINSANSSFQTAINVWTRNEMAFAMRDRYRAIGGTNCSRLITDDTSSTGSGPAFLIAQSALGANAQLYTPAGIFHHKYLIVDQDNPASDPIVLTGSHNWSASADTRNDENTLIIHDQLIANQYYQEFSARWEDDGQANCLFTSLAPSLYSKLQLAPNPTANQLTVSLPRLTGKSIHVLNLNGQVVRTEKAHSDTHTLDVNQLPAGAYVLRVEGVAIPSRFIKQ